MNRRSFRHAFLATALAAASVAVWWQQGRPDPAPVPAVAAPVDDTPRGRDAGESPGPASTAAAAMRGPTPLPPQDAPLAQILPDLHARANAGDRRAACRLGMELLRCQHLGTWDALISRFKKGDAEAEYEAEGNLAAANAVAEERLWRIERIQQCRGVPEKMRSQGAYYLRQAALAGDPHAMLAYAEGQHWSPDGRGIALGPEFDRWRQEAPGMIHAALRAGNPTAAFTLQWSYFDDLGFLSAMIPDDTYRGYVYHLLAVRLFGHRENQRLARDMDAASMERARQEAIQLHERYFKNRRFPSSMALRYPPHIRSRAEGAPAFCEDSN
ncbi:hypothetical protein [Arenimonas sp.]|uniref:hypothetical protein n=1 Tax=Arenimonas sp. TaxID=1872635 RepID=UPI0035B039F4